MRYKVGFTGTQHGLTVDQQLILKAMYELSVGSHFSYPMISEFHHGDCIGADAEAHDIFAHPKTKTIIRPMDNDKKRAFKDGWYICPSFPPLERNRHIVDAVDVLIVCPKQFKMILRSGTWATYRHAFKKGMEIWLIKPDGSLDVKHKKDSCMIDFLEALK